MLERWVLGISFNEYLIILWVIELSIYGNIDYRYLIDFVGCDFSHSSFSTAPPGGELMKWIVKVPRDLNFTVFTELILHIYIFKNNLTDSGVELATFGYPVQRLTVWANWVTCYEWQNTTAIPFRLVSLLGGIFFLSLKRFLSQNFIFYFISSWNVCI